MNKTEIKDLQLASEKLNNAVALLDEVKGFIEDMHAAKEEKFDNMSEKAQEGDRGNELYEVVQNLSSTLEAIESAIESANEAESYCSDFLNS